MNYDKIGTFIAAKRKEKNFTQKELASLIGVTDKAVSKWERGQGCPDVSILEVLATTLGVSILELLKGRIIENEIIPVTEMNDYVKETLDYSNQLNQNKTKNIFSKIIIVLIFLIGLFLIILNINHIFYLNQKEYYEFDNKIISDMKKNIYQIEKNIEIIKNNQGIFNTEDYQKILEHLNNTFPYFKDLLIFKYHGGEFLKLIDFYKLDLDFIPISSSIDIYNILEKYNEEIKDYKEIFTDTWMARSFLGSKLYSEPKLSYQYKLVNFDIFDSYFVPSAYRMSGRLVNYKYQINAYLYMTKNIMKVGEIHE